MKALELTWMGFEDEPLRRETEIVELRMYGAAQGGAFGVAGVTRKPRMGGEREFPCGRGRYRL